MKLVFIVGIGGFFGSTARFLIQKYFPFAVQSSFPVATLLINLSGSFLIGLIYGLSNRYNIMSADLRLFLTTGFCGGFTTFSTFSNESLLLLKAGDYKHFLVYTTFSIIAGIFFTFFGYYIVK